jgi:hypothetical protein
MSTITEAIMREICELKSTDGDYRQYHNTLSHLINLYVTQKRLERMEALILCVRRNIVCTSGGSQDGHTGNKCHPCRNAVRGEQHRLGRIP